MASTEIISAADYRAGLTGKAPRKAKPKPYPVAEANTVFPAGYSGATYALTYQGPGLSSNKWYAGMHWSARKKLKAEWRTKFHPIIVAANMSAFRTMRVDLRYCARLDADNCTAMIKLLCDQLKGWFIEDDSPKFFKGFSVEYDESLLHNCFVFKITELT